MTNNLPILYSFRRCPFAMRARMALAVSQTQCRLREVVLRDKPPAMLEISPKGTVPVLQIDESRVLEESIDIMLWALNQRDPENWLGDDATLTDMKNLIADTQSHFKDHLDRYKYPNRYEDSDPIFHREQALKFITKLDQLLSTRPFLFSDVPMLADIAIFPFIRQFANTDREWFDEQAQISAARDWLARCLELPIYTGIMEKYSQWHEGDEDILFGAAHG